MLVGPNTEIIDAENNTVIPGFIDAHTHIAWNGMNKVYLYLGDTKSLEEAVELTDEEAFVREKEIKLYDNCTKSLNATIKLQEEIEYALEQLKEKGINMEDLIKISDLTQEYNVDLYDVIVDTFRSDDETKTALIETLETIDNIFTQYDNWKDVDLKIF